MSMQLVTPFERKCEKRGSARDGCEDQAECGKIGALVQSLRMFEGDVYANAGAFGWNEEICERVNASRISIRA